MKWIKWNSTKRTFLKLFSLVFALTSFLSLMTSIHMVKAQEEQSKNIVGYFTEWGIYPGHNYYEVANIPWDKITHINYAFAKIENGKIAIYDAWAAINKPFGDDTWDTPLKGNFGQLIKYKKLYPKVKTLISVGGWSQSKYFSDVALTEASRTLFVDSCVDFIRKYQFDGVDIDWEYPVSGGQSGNITRPEDKQNFTLLLKTLREKLNPAGAQDGKKYLLTIAAPAGYSHIANTEPGLYHQYLDFINLMTYDYNGAWDKVTNHLSPLFTNPEDPSSTDKREKANTDWTVREFLKQGVPAGKLNVGVPYYSCGWKDITGGTNGLFGQANGSPVGIWNDPGSATGTNPFYHIKEVLEAPGSGFIKYRDDYSKVPYLWNPATKELYSYEDEISLKNKCEYVLKNNLGGIMFWELSGDYPSKGDTLTTVVYNSLSTSLPQPTATPTGKYKISGYIRPDFIYEEASGPDIKAGFRIEIEENGMYAQTDGKGYFEILNVPVNQIPYTLIISKHNYLLRHINNIVVKNDMEIGSETSPVFLWAGDIGSNGAQDHAINMSDIMELARVFNSAPGDGRYSLDCDFNKDGAINMSDIMIVAQHFNKGRSDYPDFKPY